MTFEEWFDKDDANYVEDLARAAWGYQQKIIDGFKQANNDLAKAAIIPEGYVLVPVEPTEKMIDAFWNAVEVGNEAKLIDVFTAMINAAQEEE